MCVVFCADLSNQRCLGKVRDRNYDPKLELLIGWRVLTSLGLVS